MRLARLVLPALLLVLPTAGHGAAPAADRLAFTHASTGHEAPVSPPAIAVGGDGRPIVAWVAPVGDGNTAFVARPAAGGRPVAVNPSDRGVDSLHQAPGLAVGPAGRIPSRTSRSRRTAPCWSAGSTRATAPAARRRTWPGSSAGAAGSRASPGSRVARPVCAAG